MTEYMTVAQAVEVLGPRAAKILSEHGVKAVRVYPATAVRAITRPGQGARTDCAPTGDLAKIAAATPSPASLAIARHILTRAGGDPSVAGPLAAWADHARLVGDRHRRVFVAADGRLVAEARYTRGGPGRPGGAYITQVADEADRDVLHALSTTATVPLRRRHGPVVEVTYSQACISAVPTR